MKILLALLLGSGVYSGQLDCSSGVCKPGKIYENNTAQGKRAGHWKQRRKSKAEWDRDLLEQGLLWHDGKLYHCHATQTELVCER